MRSRLIFVSTKICLMGKTSLAWSGCKKNKAISTCCLRAKSTALPEYGLAGVNLSSKWLDLVRDGKVVATASVGESSDKVRYGVRINKSKCTEAPRCEEFVEQVFQDGKVPPVRNPVIESINATLIDMWRSSESQSGGVKYKMDGLFAAQLQLVRTLRPPPSKGFSVDSASSSSTPPPYEESLDSFLTGPLRLQNRPRAALLDTLKPTNTPWDVYHNVSPADARGHFLLIPTLDDPENNRGQRLISNDCHDLVHLVSTVAPVGSLLISFNSVGAGASQNHVHCHAWSSPPIPLLSTKTDIDGWNCYAVSKVAETHDEIAMHKGAVRISFLKYPCFCVKVSSTNEPLDLNLSGKSLNTILDTIGDSPHNVGLLNHPTGVHVYIFIRRAERSLRVAPTLKLGSSEMMGVFHTQTLDEMQKLGTAGNGARALRDVSYKSRDALWSKIKNQVLKKR